MDSDLLIPIFWTIVFSSLVIAAYRRWTKKLPSNKKWIRPENDENQNNKKINQKNNNI